MISRAAIAINIIRCSFCRISFFVAFLICLNVYVNIPPKFYEIHFTDINDGMSPKGTVSYGAVTEREIKDGEEGS
jgi:hypothetical protein